MFLVSLITPVILIILFVAFLGNVYRNSFLSTLPEGIELPERLINGFIGGWLFSSLLSVSCVTVAFCSNMLSVQDKATGALTDLLMTPVKKTELAVAYFFAAFVSTLIVVSCAFALCLIYRAIVGWYLSIVDLLLVFLDIIILVLFGTVLSSLINIFLSTQGQISAVSTAVSSTYGFISGAYMPLSQFSEGLRNILCFLPGTYGTSLLRNHFMNGTLKELEKEHIPPEAIKNLSQIFDGSLFFFGNEVSVFARYLVIVFAVLLIMFAYIAING